MRDVIELIRDLSAIEDSKRTYSEAFDRLAELRSVQDEQRLPLTARLTAYYAFIAMRAYRAERDDPEVR